MQGYLLSEAQVKFFLNSAKTEVSNLRIARGSLKISEIRLRHYEDIWEKEKDSLDDKRRKEVAFKMRKYRNECDIYLSEIAAIRFELNNIFKDANDYFRNIEHEKLGNDVFPTNENVQEERKSLSELIEDDRFIEYICGTGKLVLKPQPVRNFRH